MFGGSDTEGAGGPRRRRPVRLALIVLLVLALPAGFVACRAAERSTAGPAPPPRPSDIPSTLGGSASPEATDKGWHKPKPPAKKCKVTAIAEPTCGAWWGISLGEYELTGLERTVGRKFDIVYEWHGVDQPAVPTDGELARSRQGRFLHVNVEARRFLQPGHPAVRYSEIINGHFDGPLKAQAKRFGKAGQKVFVTFDHEADAKTRYNVRGTPAEFVAAWRHIVDLYRKHGADNVVFVWNVTGWSGNFGKLPGLWPGNDYVDWLSWEGYNMSACRPEQKAVLSFDAAVRPMYDWVQRHGPDHGIDRDKPVMISEMGTTSLGGHTADWYRAIPGTLRDLPRIRAVKLWNERVGPCDFRLPVTGGLGAFTAAGADPYLNHAH
ncbi:MAG: glycosyl hydrolase family 26 [Streptosporangiales bacterium]|nr:glycosyl hydrolase family 26 [Streptosporangiales bacterium]